MQPTFRELSMKPLVRSRPGVLDESELPRALWIISDDGVMDAAIARIAEDDSSWLLRRPRSDAACSEVLSSDWVAAVDHAVSILGVTHAYLCGHSMLEPVCESVDLPRFGRPAGGGRSLMERLQGFQRRSDCAKRHLIDDLSLLRGKPAVAAAVKKGRLSLHGLFYLCEAGIFLHYNQSRGHLEPLEVASCISR